MAAWLAVASLVAHLLLTTPGGSPYTYQGGFTLVALSTAVLLAALVGAPPWPLTRLLEARPLGWVGRISYGAYLWNVPVLLALIPRPELYSGPRVVAVWVGTLAAGALSHYCLEVPFLRLKQRLDRRTPDVRLSRSTVAHSPGGAEVQEADHVSVQNRSPYSPLAAVVPALLPASRSQSRR